MFALFYPCFSVFCCFSIFFQIHSDISYMICPLRPSSHPPSSSPSSPSDSSFSSSLSVPVIFKASSSASRNPSLCYRSYCLIPCLHPYGEDLRREVVKLLYATATCSLVKTVDPDIAGTECDIPWIGLRIASASRISSYVKAQAVSPTDCCTWPGRPAQLGPTGQI